MKNDQILSQLAGPKHGNLPGVFGPECRSGKIVFIGTLDGVDWWEDTRETCLSYMRFAREPPDELGRRWHQSLPPELKP